MNDRFDRRERGGRDSRFERNCKRIVNIPVKMIASLIGAKGKNINNIVSKTDTKIDVKEDGTIKIFGKTEESLDKAEELIKGHTKFIKIGEEFKGPIAKIIDSGAFVKLTETRDGFLRFKDYEHSKKYNVGDVLNVKVERVSGEEGKVAVVEL